MVKTVIKGNGERQEFSSKKIARAIQLANLAVNETDRMDGALQQEVLDDVVKMLDGFTEVSVDNIHDMVERALSKYPDYFSVCKEYVTYRSRKREQKKFSPIEEKVLSLIKGTSDLRGDNANKHIDDNSSMRDYIAGVTCKSIANKILPKDIVEAHIKGLIHWHDADYSPVQPLHNCDLIDIRDMFRHGFLMGDTLIQPNDETTFETACNLLAQVNLQVSGRQYGGQTVSWAHLLPFVQNSRKVIRKSIVDDWNADGVEYDETKLNERVEEKLRKEIQKGIKTYQYQVLCHSSSNGQTPFVSNNLCLREAETQQELDDFAMVIEEIFKRRIKGVKNASGHYVAPLFPKLLYWICDGLNANDGDPYFYLTELAAKCEVSRMQPDIVSESKTREVKEGQIIPSMGCRSLLHPIWEEVEYPLNQMFYWTDKAKGSYPYGTFIKKRDFASIPEGVYEVGYSNGEFPINFAGNTGWLKQKTATKVIIVEPKVYGRWNNGVVTVNLPHVALESKESGKNFYDVLDERLELCHKALKIRHEYCRTILAKNSPILWMHGALARISGDCTVGDLMNSFPQRATISLGFAGLYEVCRILTGESNSSPIGQKLSIEVLTYMNDKCKQWKRADNVNYSIYGTPEESLTYKFATANRRDFGLIKYVTDKDYVVNSYHIDPREQIDAFKKLSIEGKYLSLSSGGAVSYVEVDDLSNNLAAVISIIQWMNKHTVYAEINRKLGVCYKCGHVGRIDLVKTTDGIFKFSCPECGNDDDKQMDVTARLCGYLGKVNAGNTNRGRLDDIYNRVIHTDCFEEKLSMEEQA